MVKDENMGFDQRAMQDMMKQAQQMQAQMEKAQSGLAEEVVEGSAGGGMVTATVSGQLDLKSITIGKEVVDPEDVEMLQDLVLSAVTDALEKAKALQAERLGAITGGLNLPF
jgi:DNA-binding YbaB/EbfC family protein